MRMIVPFHKKPMMIKMILNCYSCNSDYTSYAKVSIDSHLTALCMYVAIAKNVYSYVILQIAAKLCILELHCQNQAIHYIPRFTLLHA